MIWRAAVPSCRNVHRIPLVLDGTAHCGSGFNLPKANSQSLSGAKDNPIPEDGLPIFQAN